MVQPMQMQYAVWHHNAHQYYGFCGCHGGHTNYCGQGGHDTQRRGNWQGGPGGRINRDIHITAGSTECVPIQAKYGGATRFWEVSGTVPDKSG